MKTRFLLLLSLASTVAANDVALAFKQACGKLPA